MSNWSLVNSGLIAPFIVTLKFMYLPEALVSILYCSEGSKFTSVYDFESLKFLVPVIANLQAPEAVHEFF